MTPRPLTVQWASTGAIRLPLRSRSQHSTTPASGREHHRDDDPYHRPGGVTAHHAGDRGIGRAAAERRQDMPQAEQARGQQGRGEHAVAAAQQRPAAGPGTRAPPGGRCPAGSRPGPSTAPRVPRPPWPSGSACRTGATRYARAYDRPDQRRRGRSPPQARRPGRTGQPEIGRREPLGPGDHDQARGQPQPHGDVGAGDQGVDHPRHRQRGKDEPDPGPLRRLNQSAHHGSPTGSLFLNG